MKIARAFFGFSLVVGLSLGAVAEAALVTVYNGADKTIVFRYDTKPGLVARRTTSQRIGAFKSWQLDTSLAAPQISVEGDGAYEGPGFASIRWQGVLKELCVGAKIVYVRNGERGRFLVVSEGSCGQPYRTK
jgi:hypothetical protein